MTENSIFFYKYGIHLIKFHSNEIFIFIPLSENKSCIYRKNLNIYNIIIYYHYLYTLIYIVCKSENKWFFFNECMKGLYLSGGYVALDHQSNNIFFLLLLIFYKKKQNKKTNYIYKAEHVSKI